MAVVTYRYSCLIGPKRILRSGLTCFAVNGPVQGATLRQSDAYMAILTQTPIDPAVDYRAVSMRDILESYRQRIKRVYPKAVFDTIFVLGISDEEYAQYLEGLFQPGMDWTTRKTKWQVVAIRQAKEFNLLSADGFYKFFHYTNYRPQWTKPKGFIADPNVPHSVDHDAV